MKRSLGRSAWVRRGFIATSCVVVAGLTIAIAQEKAVAKSAKSHSLSPILGPGAAMQSVGKQFDARPSLIVEGIEVALEPYEVASEKRRTAAIREFQRRMIVDRLFGEPTTVDLLRGLPAFGRDGGVLAVPASSAALAVARLRSVALLASRDALLSPPTSYPLNTASLSSSAKLCPSSIEPYAFRDQEVILASERCTASLIGGATPQLLTARHCVPKFPDVDGLIAVFDYLIPADSETLRPQRPEILRLTGKAIGTSQYGGPGSKDDWALLPLPAGWSHGTRPLLDVVSSTIAQTDRLYTLHHPLGLPLKFTPDGYQSTDQTEPGQILAALDIFGGSSGAPVFSASTDQLVGIVQSSASSTMDFGVGMGAPPCRVLAQCVFDLIPRCAPVVLGRITPEVLVPPTI